VRGWLVTPGYYLPDVTTIAGSDETVAWPAYSNWIDYELELVAVIGKRGKDISRERAADHIFGYTILNDLSAREAQLKAMATGAGPGKGKDFDKSNPLGPCIVTVDEIPEPYALEVRIFVNGEQWSSGTTAGPQWRFADCISHASQAQTIVAGELISTGCVANSGLVTDRRRNRKHPDCHWQSDQCLRNTSTSVAHIEGR
jgi:2-keto-4-pentenoate hydratase/2-oxohepta-3-ene-1,7-dioic acid hydratase in catechol pathway